MEEKDKKALQDNLYVLSEMCNFDNILMYLKNQKVFTERQLRFYENDIFKIKGEELKCQQLFEDIQTRGPHAYSILLQCLKDTGHEAPYSILVGQKRGRVAEQATEDILRVSQGRSLFAGPDIYKMTSNPKGYYIFINNINFHSIDQNRTGAEQDKGFVEILENMGYCGFGDGYYCDQTTEQMRNLLETFAQDDSLTQVDSCIIAISSHGDIHNSQLLIEGVDNYNRSKPLLCNEIISLFNSERCKLRPNCPKIFIFQACRGDGRIINDQLLGDITHVEEPEHQWQDTFLLAPCIEGLKANRDPELGSWLFMALKDVFKDHAHNQHLAFMKNLVNDKFDEYYKVSRHQQTLSFHDYGVSKKLYFNPGLYEHRN